MFGVLTEERPLEAIVTAIQGMRSDIRLATAGSVSYANKLRLGTGPVFIKHLKSNVYVTLNAIGSFQCNLHVCSYWLIQIFIT